MKKYILFDSDGILVDTEQYYYKASVEILKEIGLDLTFEDFREVSLIQGKGVWNAFPDRLTDESEIAELRAKRDVLYHSMIQSEPISIPNVETVIDELHSEYKMAIVTSALKNDFLAIHKRTGFLNRFEFFLANGEYPKGKPNPDPYLTALAKFDGDVSEAVVIEDSLRGVQAGVSAGITTIAIPTEMTKGSDFSIADYVLDSISELPALLKTL